MTSDVEKLVGEDVVAAELGVDRARLRDWRVERLTKGHHWTTRAKAVVYTETGLTRVRELVTEALERVPWPDAVGWAKPPPNFWEPFTKEEAVWVRIRRVLANPHVLEGELEGGKVVRLQVRASPLWEAGLVLPSVKIGDDFFEYRGRMPRYRRRW